MDAYDSPDTPDEYALAADPPRPSRLVPFLVYGSVSGALFVVGTTLRASDDPVTGLVGDYSYLGACLSGVAAAIFGCTTLSRALRRRARRGPR